MAEQSENPLPTDSYSLELRKAMDDPAAFNAQSTIQTSDYYGNTETWIAQTFRRGDGREVVFLQHNTARGGTRHVLPPDVTAALARHRDQLVARVRRRGAHKAIATRLSRGDKLGNPAALRKARATKRKG